MDKHTPQAVDDRLDQALEEHRAELDNLVHTTKPGESAAELTAALEGVPLHDLDLYALEAWFVGHELPDLDKPDLRYTPAAIPCPPNEPPGLWETLEALVPDMGKKGEAAAMVLFVLAAARAVRECRP